MALALPTVLNKWTYNSPIRVAIEMNHTNRHGGHTSYVPIFNLTDSEKTRLLEESLKNPLKVVSVEYVL